MKKSQKLLSLILSILIFFCGCSAQKEVTSLELPGGPAAPQESLDLNAAPSAPTVEIDTTQKETDNETYYLERQRLSLPEPLLSVTAQTVLDDTILIGGFSTDGVALAWMTLEGDSGTLQLPDSTEYLYALSPDDNGGFWLLCGSVPAAYRDAFGNVVIQDNEPEGKLVLTHYDSEYSMQETILLQTQYTGNNERFTQLAKTEKGFILLSAELLVQLDKLGAETARQKAEFEDGWRFISMQKIGNELFVLTQNRYDAAGAELRLFSADTFAQQEFTTDRTGITGLGLCADGRLLLGDNQTVSAFTPETAEEETILVWQELGVADTSEQIWQTDSGFFFYTPNLTELSLIAEQHEKATALARSRYRMSAMRLEEKQKELSDYEAETINVIRGKSRLNVDLLNSLVAKCKEEIAELAQGVETQKADMEHQMESVAQEQAEFEKLESWADLYENCTFEAKKMIVSQLIKAVYVYRDYRLEVEFRVSFDDFRRLCVGCEPNGGRITTVESA